MKALFLSGLLAGTLLVAACKKDNYAPPSSTLSGRVLYQDQPVGLRANTITLELWQRGYAFFNKIPVAVTQEGTYTATLFDGDYKLVRSRGNGPWVDNTDSITVQVRGATVVDVPVQPYFTIQNAKLQKTNNTVTATALVKQIAAGKKVDHATLFISSTQFVDANNNIARQEKSGADVADLSKELGFSVAIPTSVRVACYARIGVQAQGVSEYIYTPVQRIEL